MARLGLKLFYLRTRERGLSQRQVADAVGVRQATLSHIEQGVSQPNSALLVQLCRFLDVTPTFLLDDERGILPRTAERWQNRDALVTTGDWIELPRDALAETPDGRLLCPIRAGEAFFDDEAVVRGWSGFGTLAPPGFSRPSWSFGWLLQMEDDADGPRFAFVWAERRGMPANVLTKVAAQNTAYFLGEDDTLRPFRPPSR